MSDTSGLDPRQLAAFDQFHAKFRDMQQEFGESLQRTSNELSAMCEAFKALGEEIQVTALQLGIEDGETLARHPDLAETDAHLDALYGSDDA